MAQAARGLDEGADHLEVLVVVEGGGLAGGPDPHEGVHDRDDLLFHLPADEPAIHHPRNGVIEAFGGVEGNLQPGPSHARRLSATLSRIFKQRDWSIEF